MSSTFYVSKRSVNIAGRLTSISLEDEFWRELRRLADRQDMPLGNFLADIDRNRRAAGIATLSSAIRVHVVKELMARAGVDHVS